VSSSDHDKRLRGELAAELGWYPADLDDESIARHRADAARKKSDRDPAMKWAPTMTSRSVLGTFGEGQPRSVAKRSSCATDPNDRRMAARGRS
jgi:hypothetical protein